MSYIRTFIIAALLVLLPFLGLGFHIGQVEGDLTRVGHFAERDFAMRVAHPPVQRQARQDANAPAVIVIGDSFSENFWESVAMERSGANFLTYHWGNLDRPNCLEHWVAGLASRHPSAKVLLLETIERAFLDRFEEAQAACANRRMLPIRLDKPKVAGSLMPDPLYALQAIRNSLRAFAVPTASGGTVVAPLLREDLFSNRRPGLLLYFGDDDRKQAWTLEQVARAIAVLKRIEGAAAANGLRLMTAVVPDKPTAYAAYLKQPRAPEPDIWAALDQAGLAQVNLRDPVRAAVAGAQDFYMPNDTHFGPAGYRLMGEAVAERLAPLLADAPR